MNCNCNTHNNGGDAANTATPKNKIRRGNPYYLNLSVNLNGEPATEEQTRDISVYLVDERGNKTHLYDSTYADNVISARVEGLGKLGKYSAEIVYHPSGRKERVQDIKDVVEIVASSEDEQIDGQPISTEVLGVNITADMVVSLSATATSPQTPQTLIAVNRHGKLAVSYDNAENWETLMVDNVILHDQQATLREIIASLIAKTDTPATTEVTYLGEKVPVSFLAEEMERAFSELEYITAGINELKPQTKIRVSEDDYTLQVSYDGGNRWEIIQLGNVVLDPMFGVQLKDAAPIISDIPVSRAEYGELEDRINDISGADYLVKTLESIQFAPAPDLAHVNPEDYSNAYAEQEMANRLPKSFVNQLLRLFNESMGKTDRDPDIITRIYDLEKKVKALENR